MKKVLYFSVLVASLLIIKNLVVSIYNLWQKQDLIVATQQELKEEKERNKKLKEQLAQASSSAFIEEQARNKLFMSKSGEQEILISKKLLEPQNTSQPQAEAKPYWQQWVDLFF